MEEANYWWEQARKYRERAEKAEFQELSEACEAVAEDIKAHAPGG